MLCAVGTGPERRDVSAANARSGPEATSDPDPEAAATGSTSSTGSTGSTGTTACTGGTACTGTFNPLALPATFMLLRLVRLSELFARLATTSAATCDPGDRAGMRATGTASTRIGPRSPCSASVNSSTLVVTAENTSVTISFAPGTSWASARVTSATVAMPRGAHAPMMLRS